MLDIYQLHKLAERLYEASQNEQLYLYNKTISLSHSTQNYLNFEFNDQKEKLKLVMDILPKLSPSEKCQVVQELLAIDSFILVFDEEEKKLKHVESVSLNGTAIQLNV
jgi:predicted Zn-dependent peptidase